MVIKLWLINATRGYDLTNEPQTLEALQNVFTLICPYYAYILLNVKKQMF